MQAVSRRRRLAAVYRLQQLLVLETSFFSPGLGKTTRSIPKGLGQLWQRLRDLLTRHELVNIASHVFVAGSSTKIFQSTRVGRWQTTVLCL